MCEYRKYSIAEESNHYHSVGSRKFICIKRRLSFRRVPSGEATEVVSFVKMVEKH